MTPNERANLTSSVNLNIWFNRSCSALYLNPSIWSLISFIFWASCSLILSIWFNRSCSALYLNPSIWSLISFTCVAISSKPKAIFCLWLFLISLTILLFTSITSSFKKSVRISALVPWIEKVLSSPFFSSEAELRNPEIYLSTSPTGSFCLLSLDK